MCRTATDTFATIMDKCPRSSIVLHACGAWCCESASALSISAPKDCTADFQTSVGRLMASLQTLSGPDQQHTALLKAHGHSCWAEDMTQAPLQTLFWSRPAAQRLLTMLCTWLPRPALMLCTTGPVRTEAHGHPCSLEDMTQPPLRTLFWSRPAAQRLADDAVHLAPPASAHAAHHRSCQDGGAWACLLASRPSAHPLQMLAWA